MFSRRSRIALILMLAAVILLVLPKSATLVSANNLNRIYLPLVMNKYPPMRTIFGSGVSYIGNPYYEKMSQAGIEWVRADYVVSWAAVEPEKGTRNWSALAGLAQQWQAASSLGIAPIVVVRVTPSWAQQFPGYSCGPMKPTEYASFASFMHDLVDRYSVAPYNVKYWEIWNEPDIDHRNPTITPTSDWGCWGNQDDASYYGGGVYADMLKEVYPQVKAADSQSQVLIGGLLLDCDPRVSAACTKNPPDPYSNRPPKFLAGILYHNGANDGGNYFDGVSFHAYDYFYRAGLGVYGNTNFLSSWNTTGPVLIAKTQYIQWLLNQYHVSGKFLMNTEVALICGGCSSNDANYETSKAYYVAQSYAAAIAQGLRANLWYSAEGWRNSGLLNADLSPRPAYTAFQFAKNELRNSTFVREISDYGGVKGYEFQRGDRRVWVLWSLDGANHTINLPGVPLAIYRVNGTSMTPIRSLKVTLEPLYLEWNP